MYSSVFAEVYYLLKNCKFMRVKENIKYFYEDFLFYFYEYLFTVLVICIFLFIYLIWEIRICIKILFLMSDINYNYKWWICDILLWF